MASPVKHPGQRPIEIQVWHDEVDATVSPWRAEEPAEADLVRSTQGVSHACLDGIEVTGDEYREFLAAIQ